MILREGPGHAGLAGAACAAETASARGCRNALIPHARGCQTVFFMSARGARPERRYGCCRTRRRARRAASQNRLGLTTPKPSAFAPVASAALLLMRRRGLVCLAPPPDLPP